MWRCEVSEIEVVTACEQLGTASAGEEDCPYATIIKVSAHLAGLLEVCDVYWVYNIVS